MKKALSNLKPHQTAILIAAAVSAICYLTPGLKAILLPLSYLNVHLHELSHALATIATGGAVHDIHVNAAAGGVTNAEGGSVWVIGPAGYLGASLLGAVIIWFSRSEKSAQNVLRGLAVLLAFGLIVWVRGDAAGILTGIIWVAALFGASTFLKGVPLLFVAQFVGLQQCLNSLGSLYDLVWISANTQTHSDALIMERHSHIPAIAWSLGWSAVGLLFVIICLRRVWNLPETRKAPTKPA